MGIISSNKTVNQDSISCDGEFRVTLAITAAPDIVSNPTDIALVLDRSGSMTGDPLENLKIGANTFIDIIAEATGGTGSGEIGSGSHIGIVSFATNATADTQMITSVADLKSAVDNLTANGLTNHAAAFQTAINLFDPSSTNHKVIVMFTDGNTTTGSAPAPVAEQAKAQGIEIFAIGLIGSDGVDESALDEWASDPSATHVAVTPNAADLEELFKDLAQNITNTGATNIRIDEVVNSDFEITSVEPVTKGNATRVNATTLLWEIDELGVDSTESAELNFIVKHTATSGGVKEVNASITYSDDEGNVVTFPNPEITVNCCNTDVEPEPCPVPFDLTVSNCEDAQTFDIGEYNLESQGRIIQLDLTLNSVCPDKRVALGVVLTEVDESGTEYQRGMKAMTIPAHSCDSCRPVRVTGIKFVLPDDISVTSGVNEQQLCTVRNLKVRTIAHYIDSDFTCGDTDVSATSKKAK